jgi:formate dehydrogenase iron-sulfur subunit
MSVNELGMPRMGFFTDTSVCIGCKACEVACKEWNAIPSGPLELTGESFDNTSALGANTWRHVAFVEQHVPADRLPGPGFRETGDLLGALDGSAAGTVAGSAAQTVADEGGGDGDLGGVRWLMASDVCKHCTHAACLDVCPTGALVRTEFDTVIVQQDVCNGCGYCVSACPYGVLGQREDDGRVFKCTMCYDRIGQGQEPACAKACPTKSIQFGELDDLRERAARRVADLHERGLHDARLYGADPDDGVGGNGAFFLLLDEPEAYGLPPDPVVTTRDLPEMWRHAAVAAATLLAGLTAAFVGRTHR